MKASSHFRTATKDSRRRRRRWVAHPSFPKIPNGVFLWLCLTVQLGGYGWGAAVSAMPVDFNTVVGIARETAANPHDASKGKVPEDLLKMDYDQWRDIRFLKEKALWGSSGLPFKIEFFHPGFFYDRAVDIRVVTDNQVTPIPFSKDFFNYGENEIYDQIPADLGYAGFRIHFPLNRPDYFDEVAVFLGASYFRAVAEAQVYGLSARGLAVDTASENGEEFPYFTRFWLVKPAPKARELTIFAILESRSVTGAYRFVLRPGIETLMTVDVHLFPRMPGKKKKIGLAPLTSMFFYSQAANQRPIDDFRPEIHDSDGLLLAYPTGEFVWRPLINPRRLFVNAFQMQRTVGFGLLQRDTVYKHYQDAEARYDKRPSVWVEPLEGWGPGRVELVQIPTDSEKNDNIVAYWTPDRKIDEEHGSAFRYRLSWYKADERPQHTLGRVLATRTSAGETENHRKLIVDFGGGALAQLPAALPADAPLSANIWVDQTAEVAEHQLYRTPDGNWRVVLEVQRKENGALEKLLPADNAKPFEMRINLKQGETVQTETWSYAQFW